MSRERLPTFFILDDHIISPLAAYRSPSLRCGLCHLSAIFVSRPISDSSGILFTEVPSNADSDSSRAMPTPNGQNKPTQESLSRRAYRKREQRIDTQCHMEQVSPRYRTGDPPRHPPTFAPPSAPFVAMFMITAIRGCGWSETRWGNPRIRGTGARIEAGSRNRQRLLRR